jgi:hypothetical protein
MADEDDPRELELELIQSMFDETEIITEDPDYKFEFTLRVKIELEHLFDSSDIPDDIKADFTAPENSDNSFIEMHCNMVEGYPTAFPLPEITLESSGLRRNKLDVLKKRMVEEMGSLGEDEPMKVLAASNFVREVAAE